MKNTLLPVNGFLFSAVHAGIKKKKTDLSLIVCPKGAVAAGTFTTNKTKAAPVVFSEKNIQSEKIKAVLINSGNANACTGEQGYADACLSAQTLSEKLGASENEILLASTGVIGVMLPMNAMLSGIEKAHQHLSPQGLSEVAKAIMTTDTAIKAHSLQIQLSNGQVATLSGIAKGSGMIHPNMATMLGFVMTDLPIDKSFLTQVTKEVVDETFNMVTVDGDTSTNDMFLVLSSCALDHEMLDAHHPDASAFKNGLKAIAKYLSIAIAKDGEGASKLLTVKLTGAKSIEDARKLSKSVISSSLVKAAFFGKDANWGRIVCALGYAGADFDPTQVHLRFESKNGHLPLMASGVPLSFDEHHASHVLDPSEIDILIDLCQGAHSAEAWGCDLTYDYVKINGAYRT